MIDGLSYQEFQRRARFALRRMTLLQRDIFRALQNDGISYAALAERHGVTEAEVRAEFAASLLIFADVYDKPPAWWRCMFQR